MKPGPSPEPRTHGLSHKLGPGFIELGGYLVQA